MRFIQLRLWFLILILLSLPVTFLVGMVHGKKFETEQRSVYTRLMKAIESGKSVTAGDFVLTPSSQWTPENPVTYIWRRDTMLSKLTGINAGHDKTLMVSKHDRE
ncbi:MAG: hypothetical protein IVZ94_01600 [Nitrospirae bacterium]|nr:hypothetical protein [Nitrospirota bacterium]